MDRKGLLREIPRTPISIVPSKRVVGLLPGQWTSPHEGKGFEPMGYRDFVMGDDPRRINLPASARRAAPIIVERVALRELKVMVVVDRSASMGVRDKLAIQLQAAALLLYSAWQSEMTFGLAARTDQGLLSFGLGLGSRHFYHLYRTLWTIFGDAEDGRMKGVRVALSRCLPPNAILIYCSDFLDGRGGLVDLALPWKGGRRYDFIPVIIQDALETSFPLVEKGTFVAFANPETGARQEAWISPKTAQRIRALHEARFEELTAALGARGVRVLHLDGPRLGDIAKRFDGFFQQRKSGGAV
ncbi:MAG: DUF58 domain-containing protein [Alphaproteobacteria bacterium]|nr:DUF58 domain-containing protein [Alphaproteobacteria bacterium]